MADKDPEAEALHKLELVMVHLHERASVLSDLIDVPPPTRETAEVVAKIMRDAGEVSRQNMILLEEIIDAVRGLRELHELVPRRRLRAPRPRWRYRLHLIFVGIIACVAGILLAALISGLPIWAPTH